MTQAAIEWRANYRGRIQGALLQIHAMTESLAAEKSMGIVSEREADELISDLHAAEMRLAQSLAHVPLPRTPSERIAVAQTIESDHPDHVVNELLETTMGSHSRR